MAYRALYRVYRPQSFEDLAGQEHVTRTLQNALREQRFSHAYLFSGPRGTGKTSAAKILAKAVNCEHGPAPEPCNECPACKGITNGSIVDVLEIDAASNRGVEEIRDIRDKVKYAPTEVRYKVYIIDEVHMLTAEAFNALLKTLEEPPGHVLFILATTEPHRLPATIISRCQRFDFRRITAKSMIERLQFIAGKEQITISDQALALIARVSEGGMRDALSLFDQVYSYSGEKVELADVVLVTGVVSQEVLGELAEKIYHRKTPEAIAILQELIADGKNPEQLLNDLIAFYRDLLLYKTAPMLEEIQHRLVGDESFVSLADVYTHPQLYTIIEQLNKVSSDMKWATHPKIMLEMGMIRLMQADSAQIADTNPNMEALLQRIQQLEQKLVKGSLQTPVAADDPPKPETARKEVARKPGVSPTVKIAEYRIKEVAAAASSEDLQKLIHQWPDLLNRIKKKKIQVHAWLVDGTPVAVGAGGVVVSFHSAIHRETTEKPGHRELIEQMLSSVWQQPLELLTLMENQWEEISADGKSQNPNQGTGNPQEPEYDPFVEEARKLVGDQLLEIKD